MQQRKFKELKVLSESHRDLSFGYGYGFVIEGLRLLNRGIVVIDKNNKIVHIEYVSENKIIQISMKGISYC